MAYRRTTVTPLLTQELLQSCTKLSMLFTWYHAMIDHAVIRSDSIIFASPLLLHWQTISGTNLMSGIINIFVQGNQTWWYWIRHRRNCFLICHEQGSGYISVVQVYVGVALFTELQRLKPKSLMAVLVRCFGGGMQWSHLKNAYQFLDLRVLKIPSLCKTHLSMNGQHILCGFWKGAFEIQHKNITVYGTRVIMYFVWIFKGSLWNFTEKYNCLLRTSHHV